MGLAKGFKQTEVGLIPNDWDICPVSDLVIFLNGKAHESYVVENGKYTLVTSKFISTNGKISRYTDVKLAPASKNDLLMVLSDIPNGRAIAKCFIVNSDDVYTVNQRIAILKSRSSDVRWLYYILNRNPFYLRFDDGVKQTNLKKIDVLSCKVPVLSRKEQEAIANALSDMDAYIESLEKLIAKKRLIKKGVMQELLSGKRRLEGFDEKWVETTLSENATFFKGRGLPKSALEEEGKYQCIHYGELFTHYKETVSVVKSRTNNNSDSFLSVENDVLMPTSDVTPKGLAKASCINLSNVVLGGDILVIRPVKNLLGSFLSYLIRLSESQVLQLVTGSTVYHLYASDMKKFKFTMPSFKEQRAIVDVLDTLEIDIYNQESKLEKARLLKQGMMQELLTGRIRLV